jgi:protein gp37
LRDPRRIFVNSMSDLFHESLPFETIDKIFAVMAMCHQHTFQVLTKRPERMLQYMKEIQDDDKDMHRWAGEACAISGSPCASGLVEDADWPPKNIWLGTSVEDQKTADERIPLLLQTPAAVRWISAEPLLGPITFRWAKWDNWNEPHPRRKGGPDQTTSINEHDGLRMLDWVVVGGESGPGARPMHPDWARNLRDQCQAASVPFFFKQWGEFSPYDHPRKTLKGDLMIAKGGATLSFPFTGNQVKEDMIRMYRVGKKVAGRLLDGREHNGYPLIIPPNQCNCTGSWHDIGAKECTMEAARG